MNPLYNKPARRVEHACSTLVTGGMIAQCMSLAYVRKGYPVGDWLDASMDATSFIPTGSVYQVGSAGITHGIAIRPGDAGKATK